MANKIGHCFKNKTLIEKTKKQDDANYENILCVCLHKTGMTTKESGGNFGQTPNNKPGPDLNMHKK